MQAGEDADVGHGQPPLAEVTDGHPLHHPADGIGDPGRHPQQPGREQVARHPVGAAQQQVGLGPDRDPHPAGSVLGQVAGDVQARAATADDEDVATTEPVRVAVIAGVHDAAGELVPSGPVRQPGRVLVPDRDDDVLGGQRPGGRGHPPAARVRVDPVDLDAEPHVQVVPQGEGLQVADRVVAHGKPRGPGLEAVPEAEHRVPAAGVQPEPVVPGPPGRGDRVAALDDLRGYAQPAELGRGRQARRPRTDDQNRSGRLVVLPRSWLGVSDCHVAPSLICRGKSPRPGPARLREISLPAGSTRKMPQPADVENMQNL